LTLTTSLYYQTLRLTVFPLVPKILKTGQGAVYYGAGFVDLPTTFKVGGILGVTNILIWGIVGGAWWKIIGLY
jgi:hypothetical protein|tara:strand:+ start:229 stop:447 length:219 start_codon:yes stop_codon:yes gene_type:complete